MAEVEIKDFMLFLKLSKTEKLESLHGDISVPLSQIAGVEIDDHIHRSADFFGIKLGTRIPGIIEVASITSSSGKVFTAIHHNTPRGLKIKLTDFDFDEILIGLKNPEEIKDLLDNEMRNDKNK